MAKQIRSVVRLDDQRFSGAREDVYSLRVSDEVENGFVLKVGDVEDGNRDVREGVKPSAGDKIAIVAHHAHIYDTARRGDAEERYFYMEAGDVVRAYAPSPTYKFAVTEEGIEGEAEKGKFVVSADGYKLEVADTEPVDATGFVGKIVRLDTVGGALSLNVTQKPTKYVVIDTIQNN